MATAIPKSRIGSRASEWSFSWTIDQVLCWTLLAALIFVMGADFRGSTGGKFEVHWQIYLRLLLAFVSGVVGSLFLFPLTYRDFLTWPGILLASYILWYGVTLPMSINQSYSAAAWLSLVGIVLFVPAAMRILGGYRFMAAIAAGLTAFLIGSWVAYRVFPEVGVFHEQVTQTEVYERFGGLAHPNELGFCSAYTVLVFAGLGISKRVAWWLALPGIALGIVTLGACFSRTAMVTCTFGLIFTLQNQWRLRGTLSGILLAVSGILLFTFIALGSGQIDWAVSDALKSMTKTGSMDELATATGRTEIWQYAIKLIGESPLFGYGYCAVRFLMEDYSHHGHNIVLNAMLFGGVIAGLIVLSMILYLAYGILFESRPEVDGLAACMLVGGLIEGLLGAASPATSTIVWMMLILWRQLDMRIGPDDPKLPNHLGVVGTIRPPKPSVLP